MKSDAGSMQPPALAPLVRPADEIDLACVSEDASTNFGHLTCDLCEKVEPVFGFMAAMPDFVAYAVFVFTVTLLYKIMYSLDSIPSIPNLF